MIHVTLRAGCGSPPPHHLKAGTPLLVMRFWRCQVLRGCVASRLVLVGLLLPALSVGDVWLV
jgi:hypothetical protein